ncbi:MAG: ferredoxin family protein [Euryarchaeota archaeon]|nr:ferredoxin family protein [Euryarchaeota archaeon]
MPPIVDTNKCEGIGACKDVCPAEVFDIRDDGSGSMKSIVARPDDCIDCGMCVDECPTEAITLE